MFTLRNALPVLRRNAQIGQWIAAPLNLDPYRELGYDEEGCSEPKSLMFIADAETEGRVTAVGNGYVILRDSRKAKRGTRESRIANRLGSGS